MTADGFNNLSDCGSGAVTLVSMFVAKKPADKEHPYGHRRAEYLAAMIAGLMILVFAAEFFRESLGSVIRGGTPQASWPVYAVLLVSVAVKMGMFGSYRAYAKRLGSNALKAAAFDSLCDCLASATVLVGAAVSPYFAAADGWAGLAVSLFIAFQGVKILLEASSELLGHAPDASLSEQIRKTVLSAEEVLGVHDLRIYTYGKGVSFATLHVEMDASLPMLAAHTVIDGLEQQVKRQTGVRLTIHLDPVDLTNLEESSLKRKVWERARELTDGLELHDFRLIPDTDRVEFDVGVPYSCKLTDEALAAALRAIVKDLGDYTPVINIERE